jgi:nucleoside-diphosphate-sugar epimerase
MCVYVITFFAIALVAQRESPPIQYKEAMQDDPQRRKPDITKAKELLKWQPVVCLYIRIDC